MLRTDTPDWRLLRIGKQLRCQQTPAFPYFVGEWEALGGWKRLRRAQTISVLPGTTTRLKVGVADSQVRGEGNRGILSLLAS